jgi:transglutaminase-like putative cysteine protease
MTPLAMLFAPLNMHMWGILSPADQDRIFFVAGSTPLIFDPMPILAFGYASCTGLAILFINALRTMEVPARIAGTSAWYQKREEGNHNWVEVWRDGEWYFLELLASETAGSVDDLDRPPCERWFCTQHRFSNNPSNTTKVYTARLESVQSTYYHLTWELANRGVPGEDVSSYIRSVVESVS